MKSLNTMSRNLTLAALALALAGIVAAPNVVRADPKGAELLALKAKVVEAAPVAKMKCEDCKDTIKTAPGMTFKAVTHGQTRSVAVHGCTSCVTKIEQHGQGKAATNVAQHSCTMSEGGACCGSM